ncbi:MAG: MobC family plasmid mobilization relaxosome protein [Lachnospiraceae bacterium]|nr:MobC family plasmid mobilization relaxosome protein [Lachnospiraceae bacterium]
MIHRTRKMTFRLTEEEYNIIKSKVNEAGISQQQFLLKTTLGKEIIHIKEFQELIFQIKKIGTNVNQIARHSNETGIVSEAEIAEVKGGLNEIWLLLKQLQTHTPI